MRFKRVYKMEALDYAGISLMVKKDIFWVNPKVGIFIKNKVQELKTDAVL